jgi:hypothetical protein
MSGSFDQDWDDPSEVPLDPAVTKKLFRKWRSPRYGQANPERMNNPVWEWLVCSRATAYALAQRMGGPSALEAGPGWCFQRNGQSETCLPDGRRILIGGEHEDSYDPDFYIYNDVVVLHPDQRVEIFGYLQDVFPPTDFHSATLAGDKIFIIGCLGYPEQRRPGVTPVLCLDLQGLAISPFATSGPGPGWIHDHTAELSTEGSAITLRGGRCESARNINDWRLNLECGLWEQLTFHPWQIWQVRRTDGHLIHLWQIRSQLALKAAGQRDSVSDQLRKVQEQFGIPSLEEELGGPLDADAASALYQPPMQHEAMLAAEEFSIHRIRINGVVVRFEEDMQDIEVTFEGALPQKVINGVVKDLQAKLTRLEHHPCTAKRV